jgi:hypothetical protein
MTDDSSTRPRAIPEAIRLNRDARLLVEPMIEEMGDWQSESVRLHAAVERTRQTGRYDPSLAESASALLKNIEERAQHFEQAIVEAGAELAAHSRVSDTRRSLQLIAERLRRCIDSP